MNTLWPVYIHFTMCGSILLQYTASLSMTIRQWKWNGKFRNVQILCPICMCWSWISCGSSCTIGGNASLVHIVHITSQIFHTTIHDKLMAPEFVEVTYMWTYIINTNFLSPNMQLLPTQPPLEWDYRLLATVCVCVCVCVVCVHMSTGVIHWYYVNTII